jgi:hypothetical protein
MKYFMKAAYQRSILLDSFGKGEIKSNKQIKMSKTGG